MNDAFENVPCYKCIKQRGYGYSVSFNPPHTLMIVKCQVWSDPVEWDTDEKGYCDFFFPSDIEINITFIKEDEMRL